MVCTGVAACLLVPASAPADEPAPTSTLSIGGVEPGDDGGRCEGSFEVDIPDRRDSCTHGPDPAPPGVEDLNDRRSVDQLRPEEVANPTSARTAAAAVEPVECYGDGTAGKRVQAVYAHPAGNPDRYSQLTQSIRVWAGQADDVFTASAAQYGAVRHVRWVTDSDCSLSVRSVEVSSAAAGDFGRTVSDLVAQGYNRNDRKYFVWMDANAICGLGEQYSDDSPGSGNLNNNGGMFARIDNGCWGAGDLAAHELVHTLGGVQESAPNSSNAGHCFDEQDVMCYDDAQPFDDGLVTGGIGGLLQRILTPCGEARFESLLDCRGDDYFHPSPASSSYLATHWNVAGSSFLASSEGTGTPPSFIGNDTPTTRITSPSITRTKNRRVTFRFRSNDPDARFACRLDGAEWSQCTSPHRTKRLDFGSHRFLVRAIDAEDNTDPTAANDRFRVIH